MMAGMTEVQEQSTAQRGMEAPGTAHVQVNVEAAGPRTVVVNGADWTPHVSEVHMSVRMLNPPEILMKAAALTDYTFDGTGVVTVVQEVTTPWARQALEWLDDVDWQTTQRAVAEGSMGQPIGAAIHDVLAAQLRHLLTGSPDA